MTERTLKIIRRKGKCFAYLKGSAHDLSPPVIVAYNLPPYVNNMSSLIESFAKYRNIQGDVGLFISEDHFFGHDCEANMKDSFMSGYIYEISGSLNEKIWICSDLLLFFDKPPAKFFLKMEELRLD